MLSSEFKKGGELQHMERRIDDIYYSTVERMRKFYIRNITKVHQRLIVEIKLEYLKLPKKLEAVTLTLQKRARVGSKPVITNFEF